MLTTTDCGKILYASVQKDNIIYPNDSNLTLILIAVCYSCAQSSIFLSIQGFLIISFIHLSKASIIEIWTWCYVQQSQHFWYAQGSCATNMPLCTIYLDYFFLVWGAAEVQLIWTAALAVHTSLLWISSSDICDSDQCLQSFHIETAEINATYTMFIENTNSGIMKKSGMDVSLLGRKLKQPFMKVSEFIVLHWSYLFLSADGCVWVLSIYLRIREGDYS